MGKLGEFGESCVYDSPNFFLTGFIHPLNIRCQLVHCHYTIPYMYIHAWGVYSTEGPYIGDLKLATGNKGDRNYYKHPQ